MNSDKESNCGADQVAAEIRRILTTLQQHPNDIGMFRSLCQLAVDWNVDAATFSTMLLRAGMTPSRASELKAVLLNETVCREFLDGKPWKDCLYEARLASCKREPHEIVAARLLRSVFDHGHLWRTGSTYGGWTLWRDSDGQIEFRNDDKQVLQVLHSVF